MVKLIHEKRKTKINGHSYRDINDFTVNEWMGPSRVYRAVTPSDTDDFADGPCKGLWVGTAGNATLVLPQEQDNTDADQTCVVPLKAGWNPFACRRVKSSGLSASQIVAMY